MLPKAAGRGQHFQDLGHSFSLNGPTSRPITNIATGSEIKKQGRVTPPLSYPFILAQNVAKNKTWMSIIAAERNYSTL